MEVQCNGSENNISACEHRSNNITERCMYNTEVQCYNSLDGTNPISFATTLGPMSVPNTQQNTHPQFSTMKSDGTTNLTSSGSGSKNSNSILTPPNLYYFIGIAAVVIAIMLLVLVILMFCCCRRQQSKGISPYDNEKQDGFTKKDSTQCLEVLDEESIKIKNELTHHQLQQSVPIYEAIQSNESSSTPHSLESPSSRSAIVATNAPPPLPAHQGTELYSVLNSTDTYSQLKAHIPTSAHPRTELPNSDLDYQQLDHKTSSLKRHGVPIIHAVNRSAVAVAQGLLEEEEFLEDKSTPRYTSYSLPRDTCLSIHRPPLLHNQSLERPNLEVQLRVDDDHSNVDIISEQENFYQTIEAPPDYASLKELDEGSGISTNAMCKDGIASNRYKNSVCSSHPLTCHSPESPVNLGLVPSLHTSSHSSLTCSLSSSSAQISRASNSSPLVSRENVKPRITKKFMENSELLRENLDSNCPEIAYSEIANLTNHYDNTGVQLNCSDRYTLV